MWSHKQVVLVAMCLLIADKLVQGAENDTKIVGGQRAAEGAFPHQTSIRINNRHFCGGSIISNQWTLTAAHCVHRMSIVGMTVVVGTNYLNQGGYAHDVAQYITNDGYNPDSLIHDIAVVRVQQPFVFGPTVRAIGLATQPPPGGQVVVLSGWGLTSYPGNVPNALQFIKLRTLDVWTCASSNPTSTPVTQRHVCTAAYSGFGACSGDSGGPLIINENEQFGVVSWGVPCAKGYPDVFTNVAFYRRWIYDYTKV